MNATSLGFMDIVLIVVYFLLVAYLGWLGFKRTKTAADYLIAGRKSHPFIMALSYGATFISTSAIVGFGGVAAKNGMSILWLVFLNIFVGIFIAFVVLGGQTRRMGHHLGAHTFPELLGRRYGSRAIQVLAGLIIFLFMPLYAAAVMIGAAKFIQVHYHVDYNASLLFFAAIVAIYVTMGGLKGVMYTDALQGGIMIVGMAVLLVATYFMVGGVETGHQLLSSLKPLVPAAWTAVGHTGWTSSPVFGWGEKKYELWWLMISTITMGVGIGVLAQPQLVVRFMTVKSQQQLNRAVLMGGIFILLIPGTAYVVGSMSNAWFIQHGDIITGRVLSVADESAGMVRVEPWQKNDEGHWVPMKGAGPLASNPKEGVPLKLTASDKIQAQLNNQPVDLVQGRTIAYFYAPKEDPEEIIPAFISKAMPKWFGTVFLLTLLAAAMSTLSSQFHVLGTSIGRDVFGQLTAEKYTMGITRLGVMIGIVIAVILAYVAGTASLVIARSTAIFFGLCAAAFLPAFVAGLFWRRVTKAAALASIISGFAVTALWISFIKIPETISLKLCHMVTGKDSLLAGHYNWPSVDPILVGLPISIIVLLVVTFLTKAPDKEFVTRVFPQSHKR